MKLFKSIDEKFKEIGFDKVDDDEYSVTYERKNDKYNYGTRNRKISKALSAPIVMIKDGRIIKEYESMVKAKEDGFSQSQISKCCNGAVKSHKGYVWKFKKDIKAGGQRD